MSADGILLQPPFATLATAARRAPKRPMDEAKFEAFYRKTAGSVWSYIHRMTGNASTADDLLQKTFYRFLRAQPQIEGEDHLRHYVFKTATNVVFDHFRETKRAREYAAGPAPAAAAAGSSDLRHDMMRIFGELKPRERALLWLAHVEGCSHDEIADALGVKPGSVRVILFRARKRLADLLTRSGLAPEDRHE